MPGETSRAAIIAFVVATTVWSASAARGRVVATQVNETALDFEGSLEQWTASGSAFDAQPVSATEALSDRLAPVTLGGDYWKALAYPLGQHGGFFVGTAARHGDAATGTLTSVAITLKPATPYFSVLVGGTGDIAHERVELQVKVARGEAVDLERAIGRWAETSRPAPWRPSANGRVQGYLVVAAATGAAYEPLRQATLRIPEFLHGREARVHIIDDSASGHINVDYVRFTSAPPDPRPAAAWGYADYHTHPMSHMAFGRLNGVRTLWGEPGGSHDDYIRSPSLIFDDLPRCERGHGGGPFANPFLNASQELRYAATPDVLIFSHGKHGAPDFADFPSFRAGAHQQMHITHIRRNYEGGLRLMVGLATDNLGAEYLMSTVDTGDTIRVVDEQRSLEAQIAGMKEMARLNSRWMQIAESPAQARDIVLGNKLAVVLGVEVDRLGSYRFATPRDEVEYLWNLGVRAVTPIHAVDNDLGGAAVFIGPYNWLNDLYHRDRRDVARRDLDQMPGRFFEIEEDRCDPASTTNDGECVQLRLEWDKQNRVYLGRCVASLFRLSPCLQPTEVPAYDTRRGHKNRKGLTAFGVDYLDALMNRGMILDTAHMSDRSVADTYGAIGRRLLRDRPECPGFSFDSDTMSQECHQRAYPAIVSHAHFRAQAFYGEDEFPPSEYQIGNRNIEMVRRVGGVVGQFAAQNTVSTPWNASAAAGERPMENDCAMSAKSFAYAFHYGRQRLQTGGVGMATDFTFIPSVAPRFGGDACWAHNLAKDPRRERRNHHDRYAVAAQRDGVVYAGHPTHPDVIAGRNDPLMPHVMGRRTFDFNVDGLAHFGLVPDMLQDLKNLGFPREDFESLFSSAEGYIRMWEKAERVAGRVPRS